MIQPFEVRVPEEILDDLRHRLAHTRWPDELDGVGWDYGIPLATVKELCTYWRDKFDWRRVEAELNRYQHGTSEIDGQRLHFLQARSKHENAFPVCITHGWPGSILEFMKIIPLLTDPTAHGGEARDAFHVVCPSIPGYGFSGPTKGRGWDTQRVAEAEIELMKRLGYARYGAQGGDWGSIISTWIGKLDREHCAGIHLNMAIALPAADAGPLSPQEQQWVAELGAFQENETGYQRIQGTKPQTLGYGLTDSPAGLCAWIVEKFKTWSDCGGDPVKFFGPDELLANVTLYWVTGTINSSTRLYYETTKGGRVPFVGGRVESPTGIAIFPKELYKAPRAWADKTYNVQHYAVYDRGGHFAAMEQPELLAKDIRTFFRTLR